MPGRFQSAIGFIVLVSLACLISRNRRGIDFRVAGSCAVLQLAIGFLFLRVPVFGRGFLMLNRVAGGLQEATSDGTSFAFGYLGGGKTPFEVTDPGSTFILAFQALPLILVISAITSVLFYWRVLPAVVGMISFLLRKATGISGALGLGVAANIFVGMVESPLMIRPYLAKMTRSEIFTLMTTGMATVAGTVMFLYGSILGGVVPDALGHILVASVISAPAAIMVSQIIIPGQGGLACPMQGFVPEMHADSTMDALAKGVDSGVRLLINIIAMLIVMVALVSLLNMLLGLLPVEGGLTLQRILGWLLSPAVWLVGVPWGEARIAGQLMGTKIVLNELIAYVDMAQLPDGVLSERSRILMTYAMCGFANFASLGIMLAGLRTMAPEREGEILSLGAWSVVAGVLATMLTGAVAGILI
ncbi:MAG: hypothetical protein JW808_10920 [Victivallales bacterium]|nr:hypothetical protein [Victivallales bacterium]